MKVLHVNSEPGLRGGERQTLNLVEGLIPYDIENHVACKRGSVIEKYCQDEGIPHISLSFKGSIDLKTIYGIVKYCKRSSIDLIHTHTAKAHGLVALSSLWLPNTPFVVHRRVIFPIRQNFFTQWKFNRPQLKRIICVSKAVEQKVKNGIKQSDRTSTVYSGLDLEPLQKVHPDNNFKDNIARKEPSACLIGYVAALTEEKAVGDFIQTLHYINQKTDHKVYGVVFGEGPLRNDLEALIQSLDMAERIILHGFQSNIYPYLKAVDLYLATPTSEGLGTSIIDALALQIPVVATYVGGIPEIVINKKTGMLAPAGDIQKLAACCVRIMEDDELKKSLINNGYEHIQLFNKITMAKAIYAIYTDIKKAIL